MNQYQFPGGGGTPPHGPGPFGGPPHSPGPYYIPPNPYKKNIRRNANIAAAGLILVEVISIITASFINQALSVLLPIEARVNLDPILYQLLTILIYIASFSIPCIIMVACIRIPPQAAFPMRPFRISLAVPAVFFCLGISFLGNYLSNLISYYFSLYFGMSPTLPDSLTMPFGTVAILLYFVSVAILPAILEEMVFRGVIMQSLRRYGDGFALVVSALLFAFCHGNLVQGPPAFLMGLAIGYFVLRTGSLLMGIIIHFANNALAVAVEYINYYGSDIANVLTNNLLFLIYLVLPAISMALLVFKYPNMFRVAPSNYPLAESQKYALFFTSVLPIVYIVITIFSMVSWFA